MLEIKCAPQIIQAQRRREEIFLFMDPGDKNYCVDRAEEKYQKLGIRKENFKIC